MLYLVCRSFVGHWLIFFLAQATAWLLTITPLPASFFWPGLLLPATILAMLTGSAKFLFFDTRICTEELWFEEGSTVPVATDSCLMGESAVYALAAISAYFLCIILICFRSPTKRNLDENYGKCVDEQPTGSTVDTQQIGSDVGCHDPEQGDVENAVAHNIGIHPNEDLQYQKTEQLKRGRHERCTSDMTWSTSSNHMAVLMNDERARHLGVLSPPNEEGSAPQTLQTDKEMEWETSFSQPIVVTINDVSRSYSDASSHGSGIKSPNVGLGKDEWKTPNKLPPLHNTRSVGRRNRQSRENDTCSVESMISKISFADTHFSDDSHSSEKLSTSGSASAKSSPSVVPIPRKMASPMRSAGSSSSGRLRNSRREDRNDVFLDQPGILESKRDRIDHLTRIDEMSSPKSLDDHGDLIKKCVQDLQKSFGGDGFGTM